MICERCKIRKATIQYTAIVNGSTAEHRLCDQCASELNLLPFSALSQGELPIAQILSALFHQSGIENESSYQKVVCHRCGTSYEDFRQNSRFGCSDCYQIFDILMRDSIKQLQGSDSNKKLKTAEETGENPAEFCEAEKPAALRQRQEDKEETEDKNVPPSKEAQREELKSLMRLAAAREDYQKAAEYRDALRALEEGGNTHG